MVIAICVLFSCKNEQPQSNSQEYLTSDLPEDFLGFYLKFHSDSLYQLQHIVFPLSEQQDGTKWQKIDWMMHKPFDDQGGTFSQSFVNMNGLIIEYIQDEHKIFNVERRFMKAKNGYDLIYYKKENLLANSGEWEKEPS